MEQIQTKLQQILSEKKPSSQQVILNRDQLIKLKLRLKEIHEKQKGKEEESIEENKE